MRFCYVVSSFILVSIVMDYCDIVVNLLCDCCEIHVGLLWCRSRISLDFLWFRCGVALGLLWDRCGMPMGLLWHCCAVGVLSPVFSLLAFKLELLLCLSIAPACLLRHCHEIAVGVP